MRCLVLILPLLAGCGGVVGSGPVPDGGAGEDTSHRSKADGGVDGRAADSGARHDVGVDARSSDATARPVCSTAGAGTCLAGPCEIVASGLCGPLDLTLVGTTLYWADDNRGDVMRVPASGGSPAPLTSQPVASLYQRFLGVAVDTTAAYYSVSAAVVSDESSSIFRVPLVNGTPTLLAHDPSWVAPFVATNTSIVWADLAGDLLEAPADGGGTKTLATGLSLALASEQEGFASGVVVDSSYVYWLNWSGAGVVKVPLSGGLPITLAPTAWPVGAVSSRGMRLAIDAANVYWSVFGTWSVSGTSSDGAVLSVPLGGGETTTLATGLNTPAGIASDGMNVYWVSYQHGDVLRVPASGGTVTTVATGQDHPVDVAVDGTNVYWSTVSRIERTAK